MPRTAISSHHHSPREGFYWTGHLLQTGVTLRETTPLYHFCTLDRESHKYELRAT